MGVGINSDIVLAYAFGLILLYFFGYALFKIFKVPIKFFSTILINGVIGGIILFVFNFVGTYFDFTLSINPLNALIVGFLGIPGLIMLIILQFIL